MGFVEQKELVLPANEGCVDTISLVLPVRVHPRDRKVHRCLGFELTKSRTRARRLPTDELVDPDPGPELFARDFDGCRISLRPDKTAVEVSLPRVLGLPNDRLDQLDERATCEALRTITFDMFPWTTQLADCHGLAWAADKIALARDFPGDAREFALAYQNTRWARVRNVDRPTRYPRGLVWESRSKWKPNRLAIYDKGGEMRARGVADAPPVGTVVRAERQWRGAKALPSLADSLEAGRYGKGTLDLVHRERARTRTVPIDLLGLHGALAYELHLLDSDVELSDDWDEAVARQCLKDSAFRAEHQRLRCRKTHRKMERLIALLSERDHAPTTLLTAAYG